MSNDTIDVLLDGIRVARRSVAGRILLFAIFLSMTLLSLGDDETMFPSLMDAADVEYFFTGYDLEGLHWAASSIFERSARSLEGVSLDKTLVARGSGDGYTSKYKLKHDLEQAHYLVDILQEENAQCPHPIRKRGCQAPVSFVLFPTNVNHREKWRIDRCAD